MSNDYKSVTPQNKSRLSVLIGTTQKPLNITSTETILCDIAHTSYVLNIQWTQST